MTRKEEERGPGNGEGLECSNSELSEFDKIDVESLNNGIMPWQFEPIFEVNDCIWRARKE